MGAVFLAALPRLLVLFALTVVAVVTDANTAAGYRLLQLLTVATAMAAVLAMTRVVWVLRRLLTASTE